jgi:hypothetical protein
LGIGSDLAGEEVRSLTTCLIVVSQVRRGDNQKSFAYEVANSAVDLCTVGGIVRDAAVVLFVLGVSEESSALDLVSGGRVEITDGSRYESSTLTI